MNSSYYEKKQEILKLRQNILSWYPFEKGAKVLEINESLAKIKSIEQYDYIIINGVEEKENSLEEYLQFAKKHLNSNGTILFTIDNILGIQQTKSNPECQNTQNAEGLMSKKRIEKILEKLEFKDYKFYYPLPNYKMANIIFTDKMLPSYETIDRDLTLYDEDDILLFNEKKAYKRIIKEDEELFKILANSYLVEISNKEKNNIELISFGNQRKEKYRLKTVLTDKYAYKQNIYEEGKEHLEKIKRNIDILNKLNINTLDTYDDEKIISKLINDIPTLNKVLIELYKDKKYIEFDKLIKDFYIEITEKLKGNKNDNSPTVFEKYNIPIDQKINKNLTYTNYGLYDLIFQNCFYIQDQFFFFDQEWIEENIPIEFILYRAIFYLANSKSEIERKELYKKFELTQYIEIFEKLENILQEQIKDEKIWMRHANNNNTVVDVYNKKVHYRNLRAIAEQNLEEEKRNIIEITEEKNKKINQLTKELNYMKNSKSWKVTGFLRKIKGKMNREK